MPKLKIAIIGAGPSGFAVSEVLRSQKYAEYFDVTIYEKNNYVGGKCLTINESGEVCNGQTGGYEVGAVLVSEHSKGYDSLIKILDKYGISRTPYNPRGAETSVYLKNAKPTDLNRMHFRDFKTNPKKFWNAFTGYDKFIKDYLHHSHSRHIEYSNRPKQLNKNLSKMYRHEVNERLSGVMQGYGYADLDDKKLSPPLLYYQQYIEAGEIEFPLHKIDGGTQGIWSKIASSYPKSAIRLSQGIVEIHRDSFGVEVITKDGSETYDYLVVATPLKPALEFLDLDKKERSFLSQMKHNHYITVMCEVDGLNHTTTYNVDACTKQKQIGRVLCIYKRYPDSSVATMYLYAKRDEMSDEAILNDVEKSLKEDFNATLKNRNKAKIYHWRDYFGHLDTKSLNGHWYKQFNENFQGKNRTLYVSSGLHMETVGASVEYGTKLARQYADKWLNP